MVLYTLYTLSPWHLYSTYSMLNTWVFLFFLFSKKSTLIHQRHHISSICLSTFIQCLLNPAAVAPCMCTYISCCCYLQTAIVSKDTRRVRLYFTISPLHCTMRCYSLSYGSGWLVVFRLLDASRSNSASLLIIACDRGGDRSDDGGDGDDGGDNTIADGNIVGCCNSRRGICLFFGDYAQIQDIKRIMALCVCIEYTQSLCC